MSLREHSHRSHATHQSLNRHAISGAVVATLALFAQDAGACSCVPVQATLLTPATGSDVSANTRVRAEVPEWLGGSNARVFLRVNGGAEVATRSHAFGGSKVSVFELTPLAPLAPSTRYEVVVAGIGPNAHPPNHVFATFMTSAAPPTDSAPPTLDRLGAVHAEPFTNVKRGCDLGGPWISIRDVVAADPARPEAHLMFAVWKGNATGEVDTTKPPTRILPAESGTLFVGTTGSCDHHDFPFGDNVRTVWLGIAAVDESGNRSAVKKLRVDFP